VLCAKEGYGRRSRAKRSNERHKLLACPARERHGRKSDLIRKRGGSAANTISRDSAERFAPHILGDSAYRGFTRKDNSLGVQIPFQDPLHTLYFKHGGQKRLESALSNVFRQCSGFTGGAGNNHTALHVD
jgi:hypothetical protein